jgi:hypothetical protein
MTNLKLLRPNFVTKDLNRTPLFAYVIPLTAAGAAIAAMVAIHFTFRVRIPPVVTFGAGIIVGIITRQLVRMLLPDYVRRKDIIGHIAFNDGSIRITNQKENNSLSFEKDRFTVLDFKHNNSRETRLEKRDDDHNGLAGLTIEAGGEKHVFKFIIQTDEELKDIQKTLNTAMSAIAG